MKSRQGHAIYTAGGYNPQRSVFRKGATFGALVTTLGFILGIILWAVWS